MCVIAEDAGGREEEKRQIERLGWDGVRGIPVRQVAPEPG